MSRASNNDDFGDGDSSPSGPKCRACNPADGVDGALLPTKCGCRGKRALLHLACAVKQAEADEDCWTWCSLCKKRWGGELDEGLAAAAPPAAEPLECRICGEAHEPAPLGGAATMEGDAGGALLSCACACRGSAAKPAHLACAVGAAQVGQAKQCGDNSWLQCPRCKQKWGGELKLQLARARSALLVDCAPDDKERLAAEMDLSRALRLDGQTAEALQIGGQALLRFTAARQEEKQDGYCVDGVPSPGNLDAIRVLQLTPVFWGSICEIFIPRSRSCFRPPMRLPMHRGEHSR